MGRFTVKVDESVLARARRYASEHGTSVQRLVESFLDLLSRSAEPRPSDGSWHPVTHAGVRSPTARRRRKQDTTERTALRAVEMPPANPRE